MFASCVVPILLLLSISFQSEIKTIVTPQNAQSNPYFITKSNSIAGQPAWNIDALHSLQLHLTNYTIFEYASSSSFNITVHTTADNELISDALDMIVSFVFNSKHFTVQISMNNQRNNQISPLFNWDDISSIHALKLNASNDLIPRNLNHFNNLFPLHFILTNDENYLTFTYRHGSDSAGSQQHQFTESLPPEQILMMMITTKSQQQTVAITALDIDYTVTSDLDRSTAEYLLTIRNKNMYHQYTNEYTIRNKLALAVAEYFNYVSYLVVMTSIEYKSNKHDTFITFYIEKIDDSQWNAHEIQSIYGSYQDGAFYYLLCFYLDLEWESEQDAMYVYNQYKNGNEMYIKRDFVSVFLMDFPFILDSNQVTMSPNVVSSTLAATSSNEEVEYRSTRVKDGYGFVDEDRITNANGLIMSWQAFICTVAVLLLLIVTMGLLIKYIYIKTRRLESNAQVQNMQYWQNSAFEQEMKLQEDIPRSE